MAGRKAYLFLKNISLTLYQQYDGGNLDFLL